MNNVIFGNNKFSHYETLGGGSGARIGRGRLRRAGTYDEHCHHRSRNTGEPFPVRLVAFRRRIGSGGEEAGRVGMGLKENTSLKRRLNFPC